MSAIGACIYRFGGDVAARLVLLRPHVLVVGEGCWNDLPAIAASCPPGCIFILRDMSDNLIDQDAGTVAWKIHLVSAANPGLDCVLHALNESYGDAGRARAWELRFLDACDAIGEAACCLNGAYGNDPDPSFEAIARRAYLIGWHGYEGWAEDVGQWVDPNYTVFRYRHNRPEVRWPTWWDEVRWKHVMTEVGFESFPGTGQRRGWRDMGLSEGDVQQRVLQNALEFVADGGAGQCSFTLGHTEQSWEEGYGTTEAMLRAWGTLGPPFVLQAPESTPTPDPGPPNGGAMPDYVLGIKAKADALGAAIVGEPEHDEASIPIGDGKVLTLQKSTKGLFVYVTGGSVSFLPGL